jgi:hypothetical protein
MRWRPPTKLSPAASTIRPAKEDAAGTLRATPMAWPTLSRTPSSNGPGRTAPSLSPMAPLKWLDISDPNTATPTAPPICRVVSFTAEPTPALARGSDPMIESVAGAMMLAIPRPMSIVIAMTWRAALSGVNVRNSTNDVPTRARPVATTRLLPHRCTQVFDIGAKIISIVACGIRTAPAFTVL